MQKRVLLLCCAVLSLLSVYAQQIEIKGKVTDEVGEMLPGVSVVIEGTSSGTITDMDGNYTIKAPGKGTLVFTYIGMNTQKEPIDNRKTILVKLTANSIQLDEVVAIGYGTLQRKDLTGSITSVQAADIAQMPVANLGQALAGKMAGVQVNLADGAPDAQISIRVRGGISITQSNEPLYIVDGFPSEDGMRGIDPSDIASIDVLKDASSTSIYGARGANGVIIVTTKSGKEGRSTVTFDAYFGYKKITKKLPVLNSLDYARLEYERAVIDSKESVFETNFGAFADLEQNFADRPGIDWQKETFDASNTFSQMYKVGINGGTKMTQYNLSFTNNNDDGILTGSGFKRNSMRLKLSQQILPSIQANVTISYSDETTTGMGSLKEQGYFSRMQQIIQYRPINRLAFPDSDLMVGNDPLLLDESGNQMVSPLVSIDNEWRKTNNRYLGMNGDIQWKLTKTLSYRGSVGIRTRDQRFDEFYAKNSKQAINAGAPYGMIETRWWETQSFGNNLNWSPRMKKGHRLDAMIGQEYLYNANRVLRSGAKGFPDENFGTDDMSMGVNPDIVTSAVEDEYLLSYFTRVNYQLKDKYLFSASLRADGSSKFGANNKWGYFPAASVAWRASEEAFIKNLQVFSNLKVRLSYGTSGNNRIGNYGSLNLLSSGWMPGDGNNINSTMASSQLSNPDLKWETLVSCNLGFDMGFLDQRLQVTLDLYKNTTKNLLLKSNLPLTSGFSWRYENVGKTENIGAELAVTSYNIRTKNFSWSTNFNISTNKNKVVQLNGVDYFTTKSGWAGSDFNQDDYRIMVGESMGEMYGFVCDGIYTVDDFVVNTDGTFAKNNGKYVLKEGVVYNPGDVPAPGSWKFKDTDNSGDISEKDKKVIGRATPTFYGGINNTFSYKNFDFSVFLNFSVGNDVYNASNMYFTMMRGRYRNCLEDVNGRFTVMDENGANITDSPTRLAEVNRGATMASIAGSSNMNFHSRYVEDGSFLRISNVSLGYTFPKMLLAKARIQSLRVYVTGYNLYTFTKYSGFDPEVNSRPNGNLTPGVDWGSYPRAFSAVCGLNLTF